MCVTVNKCLSFFQSSDLTNSKYIGIALLTYKIQMHETITGNQYMRMWTTHKHFRNRENDFDPSKPRLTKNVHPNTHISIVEHGAKIKSFRFGE
jgi:hypothetical protein